MIRQYSNISTSAVLTQKEENGPYFYRNDKQSKYTTNDLEKRSNKWRRVVTPVIVEKKEDSKIESTVKNYQVLAYCSRANGEIYGKWADGSFRLKDGNVSLTEEQVSKDCDPYIVRDEKNGRNFSVGNLISTYTQSNVRITSFELHGVNAVAILDTDGCKSVIIYNITAINAEGAAKKEDVNKISENFFITADKIKATNPSSILYGYHPKSLQFKQKTLSDYLRQRKKHPTYSDTKFMEKWLFFSSEEARAHYMFFHKPSISLNELQILIDKNPQKQRGTFYAEIIEYVENRNK